MSIYFWIFLYVVSAIASYKLIGQWLLIRKLKAEIVVYKRFMKLRGITITKGLSEHES